MSNSEVMRVDIFTEEDLNKMYHEHLKDEFTRNGESIAEKKEDFKRHLREARGENVRTVDTEALKPANDNQKQQQQQKEGLTNSHNSGQGQKLEKAKDKEIQKQRFKDMLREARGEQRQQEKDFAANDKDVSGSREKQRTGEAKVNGKDITKKTNDPKDRGGSYTPQPPTPSKDFTRTFGRDRD